MQERWIPESQLKEVVAVMVRQELAKMLGLTQQTTHPNQEWFNTSQAYSMLGYEHPKHLYDAVSSGLLRLGHEVRDRRKPGSRKAIYQFHVAKCQARLLEPPEKRRAV